MTLSLYDIERIKDLTWVMFFLGTVQGIIIARLYDWHRKRHGSLKIDDGFYRCTACRWVFHLQPDGRWSSAVFDEDNCPFPGARMGEYTDEDFRYIYGDCYGKLKRIKDLEVRL